MEPNISRQKLFLFLEALSDRAFSALLDKSVDPLLLVSDIASSRGFVIYETGNIFEGVLRVFKGEDSPTNFVSFIQQDKNIEEDNRPKIPELAYEIQEKVFDPVLPILKEEGYPIKEGRVTKPAPKPNIEPTISNVQKVQILNTGIRQNNLAQAPKTISSTSKTPPISDINTNPFKTSTPPTPASPNDDKNLRALLKIATGTKYSEKDLLAKFEDLPEGLKRAITSVDTGNTIQEIAKKYFLHIDQMGALASETGLVLLGVTHPRDFVANLTKRLHIPEERALIIGKEISASVFVKIKDALRGIHENANTNIPMDTNKTGRMDANRPYNDTNIPMDTNKTYGETNIPKSDGRQTGLGRMDTNKRGEPESTLKANDYKLKASTTTPYSPEAKWNLGASQSLSSSRERLTKEEVLRGVQNPPRYDDANTQNANIRIETNQRIDANKADSMDTNKERDAKLATPVNLPTSNLETNVGPTGWKPPNNANIRIETNQRIDANKADGMGTNTQNANIRIETNQRIDANKTGDTETRKAESSESSLPKVNTEPADDFISQKLSEPTHSPEKRYAVDPYREPLE